MPAITSTGATFSPDRVYRYNLFRIWDTTKPSIAWIGLNPSTADETTNDPTVERCQRRSMSMGFGGFVMLNLFGLRSTDPRGLRSVSDPVGPGNDEALLRAAGRASMVVCCWGAHGSYQQRSDRVRDLLRAIDCHCLGLTRSGEPKHPLYLPYSQPPIPYDFV